MRGEKPENKTGSAPYFIFLFPPFFLRSHNACLAMPVLRYGQIAKSLQSLSVSRIVKMTRGGGFMYNRVVRDRLRKGNGGFGEYGSVFAVPGGRFLHLFQLPQYTSASLRSALLTLWEKFLNACLPFSLASLAGVAWLLRFV